MVLNSAMALSLKELVGSDKTLRKVRFKQLSLEEMRDIVTKAPGVKLKAMIWNEKNQGKCFGAVYDEANTELVIMAPEIIYYDSIPYFTAITPANKVKSYDLTGITFSNELKSISMSKGFWSGLSCELHKKVELTKVNEFWFSICPRELDSDTVVDFSNFVLNPYNFLTGNEKCKSTNCRLQLNTYKNDGECNVKKVILPENVFIPEGYISGFLYGFDVDGMKEIVIPNEAQWRKESAKIEKETGIKNMLFDIVAMYNDADTKKRFLGYKNSLNFNEKKISKEEMIYNQLFYFDLKGRAKEMLYGDLDMDKETRNKVEKATKKILKTA